MRRAIASGLCTAIGRADLIDHPKFATAEARAENVDECIGVLDAVFASHDLDDWRDALAQQLGQWDVFQEMGQLRDDPQALANDYVERVHYPNEYHLDLVTAPVQFDRKAGPVRRYG